jgi:hypothetical protein
MMDYATLARQGAQSEARTAIYPAESSVMIASTFFENVAHALGELTVNTKVGSPTRLARYVGVATDCSTTMPPMARTVATDRAVLDTIAVLTVGSNAFMRCSKVVLVDWSVTRATPAELIHAASREYELLSSWLRHPSHSLFGPRSGRASA